jgi:succinyl-CoA synthetase beta subunit
MILNHWPRKCWGISCFQNKLELKDAFVTLYKFSFISIKKVYVVERKYVRKEYYFAILLDRATQGPVLVASPQGGMDIEAVAHEDPSAIHTLPVDIKKGLALKDAKALAAQIGFEGKCVDEVSLVKFNL